jgi:hypothetical protein
MSIHRQGGKSTAAALTAMWAALTDPNAVILLVSPSLRQSQLLFRQCLSIYRLLGRPVPAESENALSLTLSSGARIVSLPGNAETTRGFTATMLLIDEAAFVDDSVYTALRPTLIMTGGRLIVMSTPFGKRGFFWEAWSGSQEWERYEVPATLCPRLTPEQLEEERNALGDLVFRSEYLVQFVDTVSQVFAYDLVMAAVDSTIRPLFPIGDNGLWLSSSAST